MRMDGRKSGFCPQKQPYMRMDSRKTTFCPQKQPYMRMDAQKEASRKHERLLFCGATGNRTRDTRIFSPLLYQLSYGTILERGNKGKNLFIARKIIFCY